MGRSVSTPHNAVAVAYAHRSFEDEWDWEDFEYDFKYRCKRRWPSLEDEDRWIGRENHVLLENQHARIGLSEYMGLVAMWIVPQEDEWYPEHNSLHEHWCNQIADRFKRVFGELLHVGTFSNGEAVFRRIPAVG